MNHKLIVPIAALLIAALGALGIWWAMADTMAKPAANAPSNDPDGPPVRSKPPFNGLNERDYNPAIVTPDPVASERPTPFRMPASMYRLDVSGRVVDESSLPIADAQVRFLGEGSLVDFTGAGYSDAAGRFHLVAWSQRGNNPAAGQRQCRLVAQDAEGRTGVSPSHMLSDDTSLNLPDVVLAATAELRGRVTDQAGTAVTGVTVTASSLTSYEMIPAGLRSPRVQHATVVRAATTDSRGEYRLAGLRPGVYRVQAAPSYFGDMQMPLEVEVRPSGAPWTELAVQAQKYLRGVLRDSDGRPVAGAVVRARLTQPDAPVTPGNPDNPGQPERRVASDTARIRPTDHGRAANLRGLGGNQTLTDEQGRFGFFGLQAGLWEITAKLGESEARVPDLRPDHPDVTLTVDVASSLSGTVYGADGKALEFFDVRLVLGSDSKVTPFDRADPDRAYPLRSLGEFRLINPKGGQALRVSAPGYLPAALAVAELQPGERRTGVEVKLVPICELTLNLKFEGRSLESEPVLLLFDRNLAFDASCDDRGRVRFPAVSPMRYSVQVMLRDGRRLAATLDVPPRQSAVVDVELAPAADK